jgi:hypothetical protein
MPQEWWHFDREKPRKSWSLSLCVFVSEQRGSVSDQRGATKLQRQRRRPITTGMVWFFERQESRLHYEIRRQSDGDDYELVINWPDGRQEVERSTECGSLFERSSMLESRLTEQGWVPPQTRVRPGLAAARSY